MREKEEIERNKNNLCATTCALNEHESVRVIRGCSNTKSLFIAKLQPALNYNQLAYNDRFR